jgi:hypothetical protein
MKEPITLPGKPVDVSRLSGFKLREILVKSDFPLLLLADGPPVIPRNVRKESAGRLEYPASKWLLNWCDSDDSDGAGSDSDRRTRPGSIYTAIRVSEDRLAQFLENHVSLREVILHCEYGTFLYAARNPLRPEEATSIDPRQLPETYLPAKDFSLNGKEVFSLSEAKIDAPLKLGFHLISRGRGTNQLSWTTSGPFETNFQRYLSWAAHFIKRGRMPRILTLTESDWTALNTRLAISGSYKIFCTSNTTDPQETTLITQVFQQLKEITEADSVEGTNRFSHLVQRIGPQATDSLLALLNVVSVQGVAVSVRWELAGTSGELTLNKRVSDEVVTSVRRAKKGPLGGATLTVILTEDEAAYLRRRVNGRGGWQSSLRRIQSKLKGDTITLTADEVDLIVKQAQSYGQGGFQDRLQMIIRAIRRWETSFSGMQ